MTCRLNKTDFLRSGIMMAKMVPTHRREKGSYGSSVSSGGKQRLSRICMKTCATGLGSILD